MAAKPMILRELNNLPDEALREVAKFIRHLKKCQKDTHVPKHNGKALAGKQVAAIKKWAGRNLGSGYTGREHDTILYGDKG